MNLHVASLFPVIENCQNITNVAETRKYCGRTIDHITSPYIIPTISHRGDTEALKEKKVLMEECKFTFFFSFGDPPWTSCRTPIRRR